MMRSEWNSLRWAARALKYETVGFWQKYDISSLTGNGLSPLAYHIYSSSSTWDMLKFDTRGVAMYKGRTFKPYYNAGYMAWYALSSLTEYVLGKAPEGQTRFLKQAEWLALNSVTREDGAAIWPVLIDWREGECLMKAPWLSATNQGLTISVLVRSYLITRDQSFLTLAHAAAVVFGETIENGGVQSTIEEGLGLFYAENAARPVPKILDGYMYALLGLYDLAHETEDRSIIFLFEEGIRGLKTLLPYWTYRKRWTWYGSKLFLSHAEHHSLHYAQLQALSMLTEDSQLSLYADSWNPCKISTLKHLQIFIAFFIIKQHARIKYSPLLIKSQSSPS